MCLELGPVEVVMADSQLAVKIFLFLVVVVGAVIMTFIIGAPVVPVLCCGLDALVLGLANHSG